MLINNINFKNENMLYLNLIVNFLKILKKEDV